MSYENDGDDGADAGDQGPTDNDLRAVVYQTAAMFAAGGKPLAKALADAAMLVAMVYGEDFDFAMKHAREARKSGAMAGAARESGFADRA